MERTHAACVHVLVHVTQVDCYLLLLTSLNACAYDQAPDALTAGACQAVRWEVAIFTFCAALATRQRVHTTEWYGKLWCIRSRSGAALQHDAKKKTRYCRGNAECSGLRTHVPLVTVCWSRNVMYASLIRLLYAIRDISWQNHLSHCMSQ
jgi:hypothetical protein